MAVKVVRIDTFDRTPEPRNHGPAVIISFYSAYSAVAELSERALDTFRVTDTRRPNRISGGNVESYGPSIYSVEVLRPTGWVEIMTYLDWEVDDAEHAVFTTTGLIGTGEE